MGRVSSFNSKDSAFPEIPAATPSRRGGGYDLWGASQASGRFFLRSAGAMDYYTRRMILVS